ncbi:acyltransferase family protein [Sodalis sp. RH16]|uniref:acyltransferase family protein n=1 Tax=Sodalis sp. RH16 TaxID=3394331 RepID=UPI0039B50598
MIAERQSHKGLISVQILRGIAALLVITSHIAVKSYQKGLSESEYFAIGGCGVDLFFIISGFIMSYTTSITTSWKKFAESRVIRVFPPYWILTTIALIVYLINPSMVNSSGGTTGIFVSFFLIPNGDKFLVQNGWTLSYEMTFYCIYAFSLYVSPLKRNLVASAIMIALFLCGFLFKTQQHLINFLFSNLFLEFVLGICAFEVYKRVKLTPYQSMIMIASSILFLLIGYKYYFGIRAISFGIPMFILFIGVVNLEFIFEKQNKLSLLGDMSYSLYLVHPFILSPLATILVKIGIQSNIIFFVFLMTVSIIASFLFYKKIEYPVTRQIKNARKKYALS